MPYIQEKEREKYSPVFDIFPTIKNKGELEYIIFKIAQMFMADKEYKYTTLHDCVYAIQHVSDEFRRRFLDKREDEAILINGDIKNETKKEI